MDLSTSSSSFSAASSSSSWFSGIVRGRSNSVKMSNKNPAAASGGADSVSGGGPITTKKQFLGVMFKYGPKSVQVVTGLRLQVMESATCRNAGLEFLAEALQWFEFPAKFIMLIITCVTTPKLTIKVNGEGHDYFEGEQGSVSRVIEALNHFSAATYLIANMQKSNLFVAGVTDPMKAILDKTVFSLGVFPIRYTNWRIQIAAYVTAWLWRSVPICLWIVWSNLLRAELIRWTNVQLQAGEMKQVLENIKRKHWKTFQKEMIAAIWDAMIYHIRRARNWGLFKGITLQAIDVDVAFKTGDYKQQVIFIGGLTDGFLATDYLEPLAIALDKEKWSLVQFLLSSSYSGYGTSSLRQVLGLAHTQKSSSWGEDCPSPYKETDYPFLFQCGTLSNPYFPTLLVLLLSSGGFTRGSQKLDATELDQLISYLINKEDSEGVVLLGHSTGCQDIVYYMRTNAACSRAVRAAILQAPVSDREYKATLPDTASMIDLASNMISEGRESELMPREANPDAPITAFR
ncbi:hypothetical protein FXO38_13671 [Capsicum annuum]|nr:hypothetical protein FXO38_13671 [Capsicum annuum]